MLKAVRNCRTWYSGYLASICCSTAMEAQHSNLRRWVAAPRPDQATACP